MPADPVSAGRKGGQSKSAAKLAAARRNGFQRVENKPAPEAVAMPDPAMELWQAHKRMLEAAGIDVDAIDLTPALEMLPTEEKSEPVA